MLYPEGLVKAQLAGIHQHGILRLFQGRGGAFGILLVPENDVLQHLFKALLNPLLLEIQKPASGSGFGAGGEKDFELRVRQHHGADIPSVHDHMIFPGKSALHLQQKGADLRNGGDVRSGQRNLRLPDLPGNILPIEVHPLLAGLIIGDRDVDGAQLLHDRGHVVPVDSRADAGKAQGTVDGARVHIDKIKGGSQASGLRALSGAAGAVDGNGVKTVHSMYASFILKFRPHSRLTRQSAG